MVLRVSERLGYGSSPVHKSHLSANIMLIAALSDQLARFKHPKTLIFLKELPRNAMGKVVHDQLRAVLVGELQPVR